jgi:Cytidylate kinase-like family
MAAGQTPSSPRRPVVTVAAEHGAGGDLVAPRVAEALGVPFLDRRLPASLEAANEADRQSVLVDRLARTSTLLGDEQVERIEYDEGRIRAELAEFLTRAATEGGVALGRGGVFVLADDPTALHVLLVGDHEGRVARVAERRRRGRRLPVCSRGRRDSARRRRRERESAGGHAASGVFDSVVPRGRSPTTLGLPWSQSSPGGRAAPTAVQGHPPRPRRARTVAIASWQTPSPAHTRAGLCARTAGGFAPWCGPPALLRSSGLWPRWFPETPRRPPTRAWIPSAPPTERPAAWTCSPAIRCQPARRNAGSRHGSLPCETATVLPHAARRLNRDRRTPSGAAVSGTPAAPCGP